MMDKLIGYARQIAQYRGYPRLENGLQPVERYWYITDEGNNEEYPGLRDKYHAEHQELHEAQQQKTRLHMLHEAADIVYYAMQLDEQHAQPRSGYQSVQEEAAALLNLYGISQREAEIAAEAKYKFRAAQSGNKNEAMELNLIAEAISHEMDMKAWGEIQRDYQERLAPLRQAWNDPNLPQEERDAAGNALRELVAEVNAKCPPLIGDFYYTQEDEEEAKKHGF
jgi:hypothetical protein